jgi:hypothetical protein
MKAILNVEQTTEEEMTMNLWTMIVMIVAICVIGDIIKSRRNMEISESKTGEDLSGVLGSLKSRVENLETIILEKERTRRFDEID